MARINIEECWWSDPRRTKLLLKIGFYADSAATNMWRAAQEFWGKSRGAVPIEVFNKLEYSTELIEAGLADVRDRSVYVRGSSEYLDWHAEKRDQAREAGKKSAESRRQKSGSAQPKGGKGSKKTEREPNDIRTKVNGTEPSGSLSLSVSGSDSDLGFKNKYTANESPDMSLDFERVYKKYPKKRGKSDGLKKLRKKCRTKEDLLRFENSMLAYIADCQKNDIFLKDFDTFVNSSYEDWLDPTTGAHVEAMPTSISEILAERERADREFYGE